MNRTLTNQGTNRLLTARLPTATELNRIRHTIEILKKSENLLRKRLDKGNHSDDSELIRKDNRHHSIEIAAGWEQLGRMIEDIPDSFIDKAFLAGEVQNGLRRSSLLIEMTWGQVEHQR